MREKSKVVISGISGRFPDCDDICTFKEKLYNGGEFVTTDDRKWPVGWKHESKIKNCSFANAFLLSQLKIFNYVTVASDKLIPDATGKLSNIYNHDYSVFKMSKTFARTCDILNRIILEPVFEAIVDAGKLNKSFIVTYCTNKLH